TYRSKVKSCGSYRVHTPVGERKSGMPDSVETPAPVNATMRRLRRSRPASLAIFAVSFMVTASGADVERHVGTVGDLGEDPVPVFGDLLRNVAEGLHAVGHDFQHLAGRQPAERIEGVHHEVRTRLATNIQREVVLGSGLNQRCSSPPRMWSANADPGSGGAAPTTGPRQTTAPEI